MAECMDFVSPAGMPGVDRALSSSTACGKLKLSMRLQPFLASDWSWLRMVLTILLAFAGL